MNTTTTPAPVMHKARSMFQVLSFMPHEGREGTPIVVRTRVAQTNARVFLRLVIGGSPIATEIHGEGSENVWRLEGIVPAFYTTRSISLQVPIVVQAVDQTNRILAEELFGQFRYVREGSPDSRSRATSATLPQQGLSLAFARRASISSAPVSPVTDRVQRRVLRRREVGDCADDPKDRVILDYLSSLEDVGHNLSDEERHAGRRLVQFECVLEGNHLRISCHPIRQEDYHENDRSITISCIYRSSNNFTYFTSVDIIQLLQYLADERFKVEEKNRIRRNLEGFHPTTISKSRADLEGFFTQIMEFPVPKPRNIEKDVKVFEWDNLGPAIDKIMSKYSIINERDISESPVSQTMPDSPMSLVLPTYHSPDHQMYPHLLGPYGHNNDHMVNNGTYHHSPAFETSSNHGSDSEHEFKYQPPSAGLSQHSSDSPYHSQNPHTHTHQQNVYHGPIDGAYPGFNNVDYRNPAGHPSVATHYL